MNPKTTTAEPLRPPSTPPASRPAVSATPQSLRLVVAKETLEFTMDGLLFGATLEGGSHSVRVRVAFEREAQRDVRSSATGDSDIDAVVPESCRQELLKAVLNEAVFVL